MSEIDYSTDALNVKNRFYKKRYLVFVEGQDDIVFWHNIFAVANVNDYHVEDSGGIKELEKLMPKIVREDARIIVAYDCGYSDILGEAFTHDRIIKTYGYSIENTMYCPHSISRTLAKICRRATRFTKQASAWLNTFSGKAKILLVYDIASVKYNKSLAVLGNNCSRFLKSGNSMELSNEKIEELVSSIKHHFKKAELDECKRLIKKDKKGLSYLIKGHFLTNGVLNFIKHTTKDVLGKNPSLPLDSLYALTIDGCVACSEKCKDRGALVQRTNQAFMSLH